MERGDEVLLSEWRVALLEAVAAAGSLAGAAEAIGVPYRTAWQRLKETEARLGVRLAGERERGRRRRRQPAHPGGRGAGRALPPGHRRRGRAGRAPLRRRAGRAARVSPPFFAPVMRRRA